MSLTSQASFIATAQTSVVWGRVLTADEASQINTVKNAALAAGRQASATQQIESGASITYWSSMDDANSYVTVANGLSPAPVTLATATAV